MKIDWSKLERKEDRVRIRWEWAKYDNDLDMLKRFGRILKGGKRSSTTKKSRLGGATGRGCKPDYFGKKQLVIVKLHYSNNEKSHKVMLGQYLTQARKENVEKKPTVFSATKEGEEACKEYKAKIVPLHFKLILSPETNKLPLQLYAKAYMERIEWELGVKFDWVAAVHTDTPHHHVHILINGADRDGKLLERPFPKDFIKVRALKLASDIATNIAGERSAEEIAIAKEKAVIANRWTSYDEDIQKLSKNNKIVPESERLRRRLNHLIELDLASYENGIYSLEKNWDTTLQITGRYNSFLKARDELKWNLKNDLKLFEGGQISGIVRKVYTLDDEYENNNAVIIENKNEAYFVPLFNRPSKKLEGKECVIEASTTSKGRLAAKIYTISKKPEKEKNVSQGKLSEKTKRMR